MSLPLPELEHALRAAGEPTRFRLLHLCALGELTVGDLVETLGQSQPRVSRHLKILCDAGLLERFRDGQYVFFRAPLAGDRQALVRTLLGLASPDDTTLDRDLVALDEVLGARQSSEADPMLRRFNRLVLDAFMTHPVGELLDIGVGSGAILKLLAGRAGHAVGVDTQLSSRLAARRAISRAALANCTIRAGDMYALPFDANRFDTVVLDDVLLDAEDSPRVLSEALRVLRDGGRLLITEYLVVDHANAGAADIAALLAQSGLRCGPIRQATDAGGRHLVALVSTEPKLEEQIA